MNETLQVGSFLLKMHLLVSTLSALAGYFVLRYRLKVAGHLDERIIGTIENSLIIALVVWKFSLIIFDPVSVITNPLALLYFSGGERGRGLAVVVAIFYFYHHARKDKVSVWVYGDLLTVGFLTATAVYYSIDLVGNKLMVWVDGSKIIIALLILLLIFRGSKEIGRLNHLNQVLLWFSLGQVGISFINPLKWNCWRGFSQEQLFYLSLAVLSLAMDLILEKKPLNKMHRDA